VIRIAIEHLVDDLEQLSLLTAGEHALDNRRKYADRFVNFTELEL
jgi:hypothetical protein